MLDGIVNGIQDFFRDIMWGCCSQLMDMIKAMLDALVNGVLTFSIFENKIIVDTFRIFVIIMFLYLPFKIIYEIMFGIFSENDNTDAGKKVFSALLCVFLVVGVRTMTPYINDKANQVITVFATGANKESLPDSMIKSALTGFGGLSNTRATELIKNRKNNKSHDGTDKFDISERNDEDDYIYQFSEIMLLIGIIIYVILLFVLTLQIAMRTLSLAFYYVITPLCCTSLTKYDNPQAFNVWKNSVFGVYGMNIGQLLMLQIFCVMITEIGKITTVSGLTLTYTQLILYVASLLAVISIPSFISALFGGYSAGIMESARGLSSAVRGTIGDKAGKTMQRAGNAVNKAGSAAAKAGQAQRTLGRMVSGKPHSIAYGNSMSRSKANGNKQDRSDKSGVFTQDEKPNMDKVRSSGGRGRDSAQVEMPMQEQQARPDMSSSSTGSTFSNTGSEGMNQTGSIQEPTASKTQMQKSGTSSKGVATGSQIQANNPFTGKAERGTKGNFKSPTKSPTIGAGNPYSKSFGARNPFDKPIKSESEDKKR